MKEMKKRCEDCYDCVPIGEGDHICDRLPTMGLVLDSYIPTEDYGWCNKKKDNGK